jgi:hypothetical protein
MMYMPKISYMILPKMYNIYICKCPVARIGLKPLPRCPPPPPPHGVEARSCALPVLHLQRA